MKEVIVGTTKRVRLRNLKRVDGSFITSLDIPGGDYVTLYVYTPRGVSVATFPGTHDSANQGTWYADVTFPSLAGIILLRWEVRFQNSVGKWRTAVKVVSA